MLKKCLNGQMVDLKLTRPVNLGRDVRIVVAQTTFLWHVIESVAPSSGVASGMTHRAIVLSRVRFGCSGFC